MTGALHAMPMTDFETFDAQTIANLDVSPSFAMPKSDITAFCEALERYKSNSTVFICEIGPNDVIEYMRFDGVNCEW